MGVRSLQTPLDPEIHTRKLKKKTTKRPQNCQFRWNKEKDHKKTTKRGFFYPSSVLSFSPLLLLIKNLKMKGADNNNWTASLQEPQ
jgi:hypothetical protein